MKCAALLLASLAVATTVVAQTKPRLVVVVSIDQFRGDYLRRFEANYLPAKQGGKVGGFRYLYEGGAEFYDAHHGHLPTATGPGHAALLTGSTPALHGIVGNEWFDRATGKNVYCCDDASAETVGGSSKPMSPRNLKTTTVGDELKLATNGVGKVVGIALKDRGAILMAGHAADTVIWFDNGVQGWVSSSFYFPSKSLPAWVQEANNAAVAKSTVGKTWTPLLPWEKYSLSRNAPFVKTSGPFARPIKTMLDMWTSPYGNEVTLDAAKRAIVGERLGQDDVPDMLAVSLSSNDYVGHAMGPNSPEVADICVRSDRQLSDFFNTIDKAVGLKNTLIVLSADHGCVPIVEETQSLRIDAKRLNTRKILEDLDAELDKKFGAQDWLLGWDEPYIWLRPSAVASQLVPQETAEKHAADWLARQDGIYLALTRSQVMSGQVPQMDFAWLASRSLHPTLSGDLFIYERPGYYLGGGTGTGHGSAWAYDTHIPIVLKGLGIQPGRFGRRVYTQDIASTLCTLLGIEFPTGNLGKPLFEAIKP